MASEITACIAPLALKPGSLSDIGASGEISQRTLEAEGRVGAVGAETLGVLSESVPCLCGCYEGGYVLARTTTAHMKYKRNPLKSNRHQLMDSSRNWKHHCFGDVLMALVTWHYMDRWGALR